MHPDPFWSLLAIGFVLLVLVLLPQLLPAPRHDADTRHDTFLPVISVDRTANGVPVFVVSFEQVLDAHPPERAVLQFRHLAEVLRYIPESGVPQILAEYHEIGGLVLSVRRLPGEEPVCFLTLLVMAHASAQPLLRIAHVDRVPEAQVRGLSERLHALAKEAALHWSEESTG